MGRSHHHPSRCRVCSKTEAEVGRISQTGLCAEHAEVRLMENLHSMRTRSGEGWRKWRKGMARAGGYIVLDERAEQG